MPREQIDILLNLVPDNPSSVIRTLETQPNLASQQDAHGYSLLHAAVSYGQIELLRTLVIQHSVDPNLKDEDGETALFAAENPEVAKALLDLGADASRRNDESLTAEEKIEEEGDFPLVAAFLRTYVSHTEPDVTTVTPNSNGHTKAEARADSPPLSHPPPIPSRDIRISTSYMTDPDTTDELELGEPDPEIRRRIEELAASGEFESEAGQRRLRELVAEIVGGLRREAENAETGSDRSRRRIEERGG